MSFYYKLLIYFLNGSFFWVCITSARETTVIVSFFSKFLTFIYF